MKFYQGQFNRILFVADAYFKSGYFSLIVLFDFTKYVLRYKLQ